MSKCVWHVCGKEFAPRHHKQRFCSPQCQLDRAAWKARRGSALVDLLIDGNTEALARERQKLLKEIHRA